MPDPLVREPVRDSQMSPSFPEAAPASPQGPEPAPPADGLPADLGLEDLRRAVQAPVSWLWQGYLAPSSVTLLPAIWPVRTTLLSCYNAVVGVGS